MTTRNRKRKETAFSRAISKKVKEEKVKSLDSEVENKTLCVPKRRIHMDKEEVKLRRVTIKKDGANEVEEYDVDYEALGCENWHKYCPEHYTIVLEGMADATNEMKDHLCKLWSPQLDNESENEWRERAVKLGVIKVQFPEHLVNIVFDYAYGDFLLSFRIDRMNREIIIRTKIHTYGMLSIIINECIFEYCDWLIKQL